MHEITKLRQPLSRFPKTSALYDISKRLPLEAKARPHIVSDGLLGKSLSSALVCNGYKDEEEDAHTLCDSQMILSSECRPIF